MYLEKIIRMWTICTLTNIVSTFSRKNVHVMKNLEEVGKKCGSSADFPLQGYWQLFSGWVFTYFRL
jgi:hypothetical protein